jgi:ATP-dependent Lon protease
MDQNSPKPSLCPIPGQLPMIVLSDCYLFPGCYLPLFIFEERYRQMLEHALVNDRMLCVGTRTGKREDNILPWTTAGLVRACVRQPDGTSHLMLFGVSRVNIIGWEQEEPFRIAKVEPIHTIVADLETLNQLREEAVALLPTPTPECSQAMQVLRKTLDNIPCPDQVCDILAYHFVRDPAALKIMLSEPDAIKRYQALISQLKQL